MPEPPAGPARGAGAAAGERVDLLVLIGFMAAGKTTVGRKVAKRLGWRFIDLDEEIVRRTGATIAELFRERGEPAFRALERRLTDELSCEQRVVLAPGGGWVTDPAAFDRLSASSVVVWLRVSPEEAVRRARRSRTKRPLLAGPDRLERARTILAAREPMYRKAHHVIDVDGRTAAEVAADIARLVE